MDHNEIKTNDESDSEKYAYKESIFVEQTKDFLIFHDIFPLFIRVVWKWTTLSADLHEYLYLSKWTIYNKWKNNW